MTALYDFLILVGFLFYLPKLWLRKKSGAALRDRFGLPAADYRKSKTRLIWIHAVSLGETKAVAPLARMLKESFGPDVEFVVSSGTATGRAEVKKAIPFCDYSLYLPLDLTWVIRPLVNRLKPDLLIISETDLWINFISHCKRVGARCYIVNGKMSERSCRRFNTLTFWSRKLFSQFDHIAAQSEHYRNRYLKAGVAQNRVTVTGNLKLDHVHPPTPDLDEWKRSLGFYHEDQILVIGSSHDPEERWFLEVLNGLWDSLPQLKVVIVPRHPERFDEVETLLQECGQPFKRYSESSDQPFRILLVDAMGVLKKCYQISDVALVAGSYTDKVGGHNILEPSEYGKPVLFGPSMWSQPELLELCLSYEAGLQVPMKNLGSVLARLFHDSGERQKLGGNGLRLIQDHKGATKRTFDLITKNI